MRTIEVPLDVFRRVLTALADTVHEINEPEIAELVSGALERKLEKAIEDLEALEKA